METRNEQKDRTGKIEAPMLTEEEIEKKPERSAKRKQSKRDRRIERLLLENRELHARLRKTEDRLKETTRQLVARKRAGKQDEKE